MSIDGTPDDGYAPDDLPDLVQPDNLPADDLSADPPGWREAWWYSPRGEFGEDGWVTMLMRLPADAPSFGYELTPDEAHEYFRRGPASRYGAELRKRIAARVERARWAQEGRP